MISLLLQPVLVALLLTLPALAGGAGFRSLNLLEEHYVRYGKTFGNISREQYLRMAQQLRDTPVSKNTLETRRPDGSGAKFDRKRGWYVAYDHDGTIRTFFMPKLGLRYFVHQSPNPLALREGRKR